MKKFHVTPQARVDLLEIWHFIAKGSLQNANKVADDLDAAIRLIADMPGLGHTRTELRDDRVKVWTVHSYLIVYRPAQRPVPILRVVSGRRNLSRLFRLRK